MTTGGGFIAGSIVGKLLLDMTGWKQSIAVVNADGKALGSKFDQIGQKMQDVGTKMTIVGGAIVASLSAMIIKSAKYADEMVEVSQKVGINVTTLSSYKLAADKTGNSIEGLARGLKFMSVNMVEASKGIGDGAALFKELGVSVIDASGNLRATDDVLADVAEAFAKMDGGANKTTLSVKMFGRAGMEMIPFLNLGAEGLKKEREEAARLGLVLSGPAAEAQHEFGHQLTALKDATLGASMAIGSALIPAANSIVKIMINAAAGVVAWTKEHPGLTKAIGTVVLAIGVLLSILGPLTIAIGAVLKNIVYLKAAASKVIVFTITLAGVAIVTAALIKMIDDFKKLKKAGYETAEALKITYLNFNPFKNMSREGLGKFLTDMDAARDKSINLRGAIILLGDAFKAIKGAIETGITTPIVNLSAIFKEFGLKTRTELTAELKKAEEALKLLKGSAEATPGQIKVLEDKIIALKEAMSGAKSATIEVTETLTPLTRGVAFVRDVMQGFSGELTNTFIPAARDMSLIMAAAPGTFDETGRAADGLDTVFKALGDSIGMSAATVVVAMYNIRAAVLSSMGIIIPLLEMPDVANKVRSTMDEVSTVVADAMRNIVSAIVGAFNIKGLFGAVAISVKFDSSGFDAMVKAAESAYDKIKDAANRAFDIQELRISRTQEAEDRQRSWTEKFEDRAIARGYEREDRKFQHQYEHERAAIEHSKMTTAQKNAALDKLERKYQHEQDVREMQRQHAADVRERARENAAVARERAREDAKYKREQIQAAKLLALQWKHENDLNAIRIAEDAARQKQATDEETRQKSLWFKVKGIFATAIEQMLTIWITNLITPILTSIISKILPGIKGIGDGAKETLGPKGLGKTVQDAATSIGSIFTTLATTVSTILTTLATGIATSIVTIGTAIGTVIVGLATAIASAAEIIAASAPAFIVVGLIAVGIYATIALLKRLFASSSTGAGDGMGRVVERQDIQISLMTILKDLTIDNRTALTSIKTTLWAISTKLDKGVKDKLVTIGGYLKTIASTHYLVTVVSYLKKIADTIGKLTGAAVTGTTHLTTTGAYSGQNVFVGSSQLAHVAIPQALTSSRNQGSSVNINLHVRALDGADVENVVRRRVVPILQNVFNHNGLRVPTGAVGGA